MRTFVCHHETLSYDELENGEHVCTTREFPNHLSLAEALLNDLYEDEGSIVERLHVSFAAVFLFRWPDRDVTLTEQQIRAWIEHALPDIETLANPTVIVEGGDS